MSTGSFKKPLEARKLASQNAVIKGTLNSEQIVRFAAAVVGEFDPINCEMTFYRAEDGHPKVSGSLSGKVHLRCERCLEPVEHSVETSFDVRPVLTDAQAEAHQKSADIVMLDEEGGLDAIAMLEDELLLDLPIVIYHDYDCRPVMQFGDDVVEEDAQTENPFAILASLNRPEKEE